MNRTANICIDCQNACGGCSWSAWDNDADRPRYEPVPGWTAKRVLLNLGDADGGPRFVYTYQITACPQFVPDPPRKRRPSDRYALTEEQSRLFLARMRRCP